MWQQTTALFRPPLLKITLKLFYLVTVIYMTLMDTGRHVAGHVACIPCEVFHCLRWFPLTITWAICLVKKLIDDSEESTCEESFLKAMWQQTTALFRPPLLKITLKLFYLVTVIYMT
ncbi:jg18828, partial [Pararge aegeria aegeria]